MPTTEHRVRRYDSRGRYIDNKRHEVSQDDFNMHVTTAGSRYCRKLSKVNIKLTIRESGEEHDIDINQIDAQGLRIGVFRCPDRDCTEVYARRWTVERHVKHLHRGAAFGSKDHSTMSTAYYAPRRRYLRRDADTIREDRANKIPDKEGIRAWAIAKAAIEDEEVESSDAEEADAKGSGLENGDAVQDAGDGESSDGGLGEDLMAGEDEAFYAREARKNYANLMAGTTDIDTLFGSSASTDGELGPDGLPYDLPHRLTPDGLEQYAFSGSWTEPESPMGFAWPSWNVKQSSPGSQELADSTRVVSNAMNVEPDELLVLLMTHTDEELMARQNTFSSA